MTPKKLRNVDTAIFFQDDKAHEPAPPPAKGKRKPTPIMKFIKLIMTPTDKRAAKRAKLQESIERWEKKERRAVNALKRLRKKLSASLAYDRRNAPKACKPTRPTSGA